MKVRVARFAKMNSLFICHFIGMISLWEDVIYVQDRQIKRATKSAKQKNLVKGMEEESHNSSSTANDYDFRPKDLKVALRAMGFDSK
jgi:hypothetical protein